jgi:SAM-dependent methyltransferase
MTNFTYVGSELELFREAQNWKAYWSRLLGSYLGNEVLEVGAGIGGTTEILCKGSQRRWVCLEPDPVLTNTLRATITNAYLLKCCEARLGTLQSLNKEEMFDTILYVDVLEHIKDDKMEIRLAANHLKDGGFLVVLAPAHQWLFTPFDEAIGHYRRYNKNMFYAVAPDTLECIDLKYLDCIGLVASLGNRFILKSKMPNKKQILFWDRFMVPFSRVFDPLIQYSVGKSIFGVWRKRT